jgi:hypothetical protein
MVTAPTGTVLVYRIGTLCQWDAPDKRGYVAQLREDECHIPIPQGVRRWGELRRDVRNLFIFLGCLFGIFTCQLAVWQYPKHRAIFVAFAFSLGMMAYKYKPKD